MSEDSLPIKTKRRKYDYVIYPKCHSFHQKPPFVRGSRYAKGQRYCRICETWMWGEGIVDGKCYCCHFKLRTRPKNSPKQIMSIEGNRALAFFNISMVELKKGIETLPNYFKIHGLGAARTKILIMNIRLVIAFKNEISKYKRQNITRIELKEEKIKKYIEKLLKSLPKY